MCCSFLAFVVCLIMISQGGWLSDSVVVCVGLRTFRITLLGNIRGQSLRVCLDTYCESFSSSNFFAHQFKMGGIGAFAEPLVVVVLLFGGAWINRDFNPGLRRTPRDVRRFSEDDLADGKEQTKDSEALIESLDNSRSTSPSLLPDQEPQYRLRTLRAFGKQCTVTTPNTRRFKGYFLSRLLEKFPFLVECWYWFLIYWVGIMILPILHILNFKGLPTRPSRNGSLDSRRHDPSGGTTCSRSHLCRRTTAYLLGAADSAILHEE